MANQETPVNEVMNMLQQGLSDMEIIRQLTDRGYSPVQITDALNQAKIKKEITGTEGLQPSILQTAVPVPTPREVPVPRPTAAAPSLMAPVQTMEYQYPTYPYQYPTAEAVQPKIDTEAIEEIAEEIVNEKWLEIKSKVSDVIEWKTYADKRLSSVDDRIKRIELSMDRLQAALLSKVQEYQRDIKELGSEMAALEGAFGKILTPFVENMRELGKITGELRSAKKSHLKPSPKKTVTTTTTLIAKPESLPKPKEKIVKKVTVTKTEKK
jgi:hypothetical protein